VEWDDAHGGCYVATFDGPMAGRRAREYFGALKAGRLEVRRSAKAELAAILERRPDLKGKSLEAAKRIMRREARLSLKPRRA
jgi:hypothetical protein